MGSGGATRGTSNGDWSTCLDRSTLWNEKVREMAVADGFFIKEEVSQVSGASFFVCDIGLLRCSFVCKNGHKKTPTEAGV